MAIELIIGLVVVALVIVFQQQIKVGIIKVKRFVGKNTETSVKIELAINNLRKKQDTAKQALKSLNTHGEKINIQMGNELKTALQISPIEVQVIRTISGNHGGTLLQDDVYTVNKFFGEDLKYFDIGKSLGWNRNVFSILTSNKNTIRYKSLQTLYRSYEVRTEKLEKMIATIRDSILSLENDKQYVMTMESLIDIAQFDDDVSANIDNIKAEISAIEKQLAMEERLHGEGGEVAPEPESLSR